MKAEDAMELIHIAIKAVVTQILSPIHPSINQSNHNALCSSIDRLIHNALGMSIDCKLFSAMSKIVEKEVQQYMALSSSRVE